ncbi:MAG: ester cyclase, partial [Chloroflexota bacterium]
TFKKVEYRAIADCFVKRNMIVEEWLVRDELTLIHQLGLDPVKTAKEMAGKVAEKGTAYQVAGDIERGIGQYPPEEIQATQTFDPENFLRRMVQDVWNRRLLNTVRDYFAESVRLESASMRRLNGWNDYQTYVLTLLSPFPDLRMTVEHFCAVPDASGGYRTATRWRMRGTHTGYGIYGEPTGQPIDILGVSHHLIVDNAIQTEWTLFDEFELLKQIHRPS